MNQFMFYVHSIGEVLIAEGNTQQEAEQAIKALYDEPLDFVGMYDGVNQ